MKKVLSAISLFAAVEGLLWFGTCAALGLEFTALAQNRTLACVVGGFGFLLTVLIRLLLRFLELPEVIQSRTAGQLLSLLFPAASLVILGAAFYAAREIDGMALGVGLFACVLIVANAAILYLLRLMARQGREAQEQALLRQQMHIQTGSILALEKSYRAQRQATHEFRNQLQTIHDLLTQNEADAALRYVRQLQGMQTTRIFAVNTHHPILDAVLNQKYQTARERDIEFQIRVNDLSALKLETNALVVLFSNLLDNAIEGCAGVSPMRMISCSIELDGALYIAVSNTSRPVNVHDGHIPTTKPEPLDHGYGLGSIRRILDSLGAEYTFQYEDGWFRFAAEIPL